MVNDDDDRQKPKTTHEIGCDLSVISVGELQSRIALLRDEIARLEREVAAKQSSRTAAENFFKR